MAESFSLSCVTHRVFPRHVYVTIALVFIETGYDMLRYFIWVEQFPVVVHYANHAN